MKVSFAQSALAVALFAGTALEVDAAVPTSGTVIQIGCTVPSSGFGGASVYSVDKAGLTLAQTAVTAGVVCSKAINALTSGYSAHTATPTFTLLSNTNIVVPGTGYSLQQFTLEYTATPASTVSYSLVGCTAPAATGGTIYSVDSKSGTGTTLIAASTALAVGANCSGAFAELSSYPLATNGGAVDSGTYTLDNSSNLTISTNGYSLQQFLLQ